MFRALSNVKKDYRKYGYVHLKNVFNVNEVERIKKIVLDTNDKSFVRNIDFFPFIS